MSRGYWSRLPGQLYFGRHLGVTDTLGLYPHAGIDPMPDKVNLDYVKLLYCEYQKYEVITMSVVGGQPKKNTQIPVIKKPNTSNALF